MLALGVQLAAQGQVATPPPVVPSQADRARPDAPGKPELPEPLGALTPYPANFDPLALDAYIQKGMADWQVPGLAIAVVKDGRTIYCKGFGTRTVGKAEPVDTATQFMIASNTKLFTGLALANLARQKRLSLDDRIVRFFPDFRLYNDTVTRLVTVRDMLTHRIGTKTFQGDFTYLDGNLTRAQIMERMRFMKPSQQFRQDFGYCNSCYLVAGQVVEKVTGRPWEAYITDSILLPLGMRRTTALGNAAPTYTNIARPYTNLYTGKLTEQPYDTWDNLAPAASIISTAADMARWLRFQLDSGRFEGRRIMPWASLQATRDVQIMASSRKSRVYPSHFRGYGLGVFVGDYNGRQVYSHGGGAVGMVSTTCFVPEERLGIVVLTNNDNQSFFDLLRFHLLDQFLRVPNAPDRSAAALPGFRAEMQAQQDSIAGWRARAERQARTKMAVPFLPEGTYRNAQYGIVTVSKDTKANTMTVRFAHHPQLSAKLRWMGGSNWLTDHSIVEYGIFPAKAGRTSDGTPTLTLVVNDFIEQDPYTFVKE